MTKLVNEASSQYGSYKIAEGKVITGILFTDPAEGESPSHNDTEVEFTADDIAKGLFLPKAGRRYNKTDLTVNNQGTQGVYWLSEAITGDDAAEPCYGAVLSIQSRRDQISLLEQGVRCESRIQHPPRLYQKVMKKARIFILLLLPAVVLTAGCGGGKARVGKPLPGVERRLSGHPRRQHGPRGVHFPHPARRHDAHGGCG